MTPDGYPDENELRTIREWPHEDGYAELMNYVIARWQYANVGYAEKDGNKVKLATGGWSGNESIIAAMQENYVFWGVCWYMSKRDGHYEFEIKEIG